MSRPSPPERAAARLARCYPAAWRARYGVEFTQLLVDELCDGPMALPRRLDVVAHGLWTRLSYAGLAGTGAPGPQRLRALLLALGGVLGGFAVAAVALWSQVLALVCGTSASLVARWRAGGGRGLRGWALACLGAGLVLALGCRHFAPHWPGTGGHAGAAVQIVPAELARLGWAATLWISAYWAHPGALGAFPAGEVAWMVICPVAWLGLFIAGAVLLRRLAPTARLQRWAVAMFAAAEAMMVLFLAGAVAWIGAADAGPRNRFAVGAIDVGMVAGLGVGLILATHLIRRAAAVRLAPLAG
jgi:hypothetical protein